MTFVLNDRVRESTSTNGTGDFSLSGAVTGGFATFASACANNDTFHYCAQNTSLGEWEVGLGTYTTSGNILTRPGSVLANSLGTTAKISFTNNPTVFMTIAGTTNLERVMNPANTVMLGANNLSELASAATARSNLGANDAANLTTGNLSTSRLNSGTSASSSTYWRGDGTWAALGGVASYWPIAVDFGQPSVAYTATVSFPIAGTFAANLQFRIWAPVNPTGTMSVVWKQRVSGSTSTVGTLSISTAGAITGVANSLITVAAGDAFTFDVPADATAVLGISFSGTKT